MKVKLRNLVEASDVQGNNSNALGPLSRLSTFPLDINNSFRLKEIISQINQYLVLFNEVRLDLYKKHGTLNESSGTWNLKTTEQMIAFSKDYDKLLDIEVELIGELFEISNFPPNCKISSEDLFKLEWLVKDDIDPIRIKPFVFIPDSDCSEIEDSALLEV